MKNILAILLCSGFLFACDNSSETKESASSPESLQNTEAENSAVIPAASVQAPGTPMPPAVQSFPAVQNPPASKTPATTPSKPVVTPAGMNPPHGEPGHDCAIAVGAPLNSAPTTTPAAPPQPTIIRPTAAPTVAPAPPPSTPTTTAPGMNPPHGEPGHDCAIAVGAPLKK